MAWKRSVTHKASRAAEALSEKPKTDRSFHRISKSPAYRVYSLSYATGKHALKLIGIVAKGADNLWRLTLSDAFGKVLGFARGLTELKSSRFVRGEFSITRLIFKISGKTARACEQIFRANFSRGPIYGFKVTGRLLGNTAREFWSKSGKAFNYIAPVAGIAVLGLTIYLWSGVTIGISVSYNSKQIGVVASEQVYKNAANDVQTKVTEASGNGFVLNQAPVYKLEVTQKSNLLSEDEVYDNILSASSKDVSNGYGLYVDNRLVGVDGDSSSIQSMLNSIITPYRNDSNNEKVDFYQDVEIKKGVFPKSVVRTTGDMKAILTASAKNTQTYIAQKGDSPEMVANMFHVPVDQLYAMNTSLQENGLTQGETIQVASPQPTLQIQYTKRVISTQSIPYQTVATESSTKAKGMVSVTQSGQQGVMQLVSDVTYVGDNVVDSKVISTTMTKAPVNQLQIVGTYDLSGKASSIIDYAEKFLGGRYVFSGASPGGFDCSGFTMYIYSKYGISLPHSAAGQSSYGARVSRGSLRPGDLVFFDTTGGISHVGIYIGDDEFVNAENYRAGVTIDSLDMAYWSRCYVTARRLLQ